MIEPTQEHKKILEELAEFESQLEEIPSKFGLSNGMGSNFDYQRGKLRFDSWLTRFTDWLQENVPGSEEEVARLKYKYDDNNCRPGGSGYGTKTQMVNTVFIRPFVNRFDSLREDILSGHFESVYQAKEKSEVSYAESPPKIQESGPVTTFEMEGNLEEKIPNGNDKSMKERFENHPVIFGATKILVGFGAGLATMNFAYPILHPQQEIAAPPSSP